VGDRRSARAGSEAEGDLVHDANGVDRTQIRAMLALSPEQRLRRMQQFVESVLEIRELNEERTLR
jgi:hypothetical protein